jgi:adenosylmethionine-8-amino-7-oxononanoate aminotransferase
VLVLGFHGGSNVEGTEGDHFLLCPPYNVTQEEIEKIVTIFVQSVEEILEAHRVA